MRDRWLQTRRQASLLSRVVRRRLRPAGGFAKALVVAPASPGSLGDEASLLPVTEELAKRGWTEINVLSCAPTDRWSHIPGFSESFDGSSFLKLGSVDGFRDCLSALTRHQLLFLVGTDIMDGAYGKTASLRRVELAQAAVRLGLTVCMTGFSVRSDTSSRCLAALDRLPPSVTVDVRDPVSLDRLQRAVDRPVGLVADVAFLLKPRTDSELVRDTKRWIAQQRSQGRTIMGINANHLLLRGIAGLDEAAATSRYAQSLIHLAEADQQLSFLFIPHDLRGRINDATVARSILAEMPTHLRSRCQMIEPPIRADEIPGIVSDLDLVFSGRMHLAIACLGTGTPVGCMTYQDKFEGLFQHFELKGNCIAPGNALGGTGMVHFLEQLLKERGRLREQIDRRLCEVRSLAESNFAHTPSPRLSARSTG